MPKYISLGKYSNIKYLGDTRDGRPIYEMIDKATGERKRLIPSKESHRAMNRILREWRQKASSGDTTQK